MPIEIEILQKKNYLICRCFGKLTDDELIESWSKVYEGDEWIPGMVELIDLSQLEAPTTTIHGIRRLAVYCNQIYEREGINKVIVSIYAPKPMEFGLACLYQALTQKTLEDVHVFKDYEDALAFTKGCARLYDRRVPSSA